MLSCYPQKPNADKGWKEIPQSGVKAICQLATTHLCDESFRLVDQLGVNPQGIPQVYDGCHY